VAINQDGWDNTGEKEIQEKRYKDRINSRTPLFFIKIDEEKGR